MPGKFCFVWQAVTIVADILSQNWRSAATPPVSQGMDVRIIRSFPGCREMPNAAIGMID